MNVRVPQAAEAGAAYVVEVSGEIDIASVLGLEEPVIGAIESGHGPVVLDLGECSFIDSSGIRLLLRAHRLLHPNGDGNPSRLAIVATGHVASMLETTAVDKVIPVRPTRPEAVATISAVEEVG
jgi:anti-sigma B factor antagonist